MLYLSFAAFAGPTLADIDLALDACAMHAIHPLPVLSPDQRQALLSGEVVRILDHREDEPSAAVGLAVLKAKRDALWIASQDPHAQLDPSVTEFIVEARGPDTMLWYGYFDLPRPLQDRQWVVEASNNHAMALASGQRCWEHPWVLVEDGMDRIRDIVARGEPRGITADHLRRAIFTPTNRGSWTMAELGDSEVLVAYSASTTVAGLIPNWLIAQLAKARLESVFRSLEERANTWALQHYREGHSPVAAGDGTPLSPFGG